jgi:hypothetical protein
MKGSGPPAFGAGVVLGQSVFSAEEALTVLALERYNFISATILAFHGRLSTRRFVLNFFIKPSIIKV